MDDEHTAASEMVISGRLLVRFFDQMYLLNRHTCSFKTLSWIIRCVFFEAIDKKQQRKWQPLSIFAPFFITCICWINRRARLKESPGRIRASIQSPNCALTTTCTCIILRYTHLFAHMNAYYWMIRSFNPTSCQLTVLVKRQHFIFATFSNAIGHHFWSVCSCKWCTSINESFWILVL